MQTIFVPLQKSIRFLFVLSIFFISAPSYAHTSSTTPAAAPTTTQDFPAVDPFYIYDQFAYLATHFPHREAGYDQNLAPTVNGHDEFASYWSQEIVRDLQGFGAQVRRDPFPVPGWNDRPATVPAFNVEVTIPGASQPDQVVIIGCHYDGEAVSTQSAYDDTSGCAIELGVARALAHYWQSHHLYPARTLRFLLFDAEEQGLLGSFHYVNDTSNGDLQNIVAMFNEEQNGMAFPVRYLGQVANPQMPFDIEMTPIQQTTLSGPLLERSKQFRALMQQALPEVFARFRALGFLGLTYHGPQKQTITQDIFTPQQTSLVHIEDDRIGSSDQVPFTLAGLPCVTFVGNSTYYDQNPPPGSYPFDQAADTLTLMNTYAHGGSGRANALTLALALPGMFTGWMLHQSAILGEVSTQAVHASGPLFTMGSLAPTLVGQAVTMDIATIFDPQDDRSQFSYTWNFGDGTIVTGIKVAHVYKEAKNYTVTIQARSSSGTRRLQKLVEVVVQPQVYQNAYATYRPSGYPPSNPQVQYPTPDATLSDAIIGPATPPATVTPQTLATVNSYLWLIGILALAVLLGALGFILSRKPR